MNKIIRTPFYTELNRENPNPFTNANPYALFSLQTRLVSSIYTRFLRKVSLIYRETRNNTRKESILVIIGEEFTDAEMLEINGMAADLASRLSSILFFDAELKENSTWVLSMMPLIYDKAQELLQEFMKSENINDVRDGNEEDTGEDTEPEIQIATERVEGKIYFEILQASGELTRSRVPDSTRGQGSEYPYTDLFNFLVVNLEHYLEELKLNGYTYLGEDLPNFALEYELEYIRDTFIVVPRWLDNRFAKNPRSFIEDRYRGLSTVKFGIAEFNPVLRHHIAAALQKIPDITFILQYYADYTPGAVLVDFQKVTLSQCRKIASLIEQTHSLPGTISEYFFSDKNCALSSSISGLLFPTDNPFDTYTLSVLV